MPVLSGRPNEGGNKPLRVRQQIFDAISASRMAIEIKNVTDVIADDVSVRHGLTFDPSAGAQRGVRSRTDDRLWRRRRARRRRVSRFVRCCVPFVSHDAAGESGPLHGLVRFEPGANVTNKF